MATPPGGHPYGGQHQPPNRYNFPSAPSPQADPASPYGTAGPYGGPGWQQEPPAPGPVPPRHGRRARPTPVGSDQQPLVRPYAMTGGRTRPRYQLAIEALVSTTADDSRLRGQLPEHQRICQLCREVKSVAEVSALLSIPLGVARILVADLAEAGLVAIHQPGGDEAAGGQPDVTLLERVLSGLRKL
ncbi:MULTISPECIES: DUF742 domain-containing protein [Streptomycetaceae]|uniref:DUF742 domain-containing protein n=1 Tax=Streptomycetaceae TaxID=2062 RepID=UPI000213FD88|nr:DUF742 domain-containing protein [Streptantibioticus cattleyicolor]MYS61216.1 DUF742 domain-containing protein [Streptomyces sp. SID5468]CCB77065.1 conserved protein of unknown function [Streptantibioticus cattleyicolor NRRL 8057 = DSM 46488]